MQKVIAGGSRFIAVEVDTPEDAARFAELPVHGIMTNRIELIGPQLRERRR
jgi:hypothetical protein